MFVCRHEIFRNDEKISWLYARMLGVEYYLFKIHVFKYKKSLNRCPMVFWLTYNSCYANRNDSGRGQFPGPRLTL